VWLGFSGLQPLRIALFRSAAGAQVFLIVAPAVLAVWVPAFGTVAERDFILAGETLNADVPHYSSPLDNRPMAQSPANRKKDIAIKGL
jgi:hypothetical protein